MTLQFMQTEPYEKQSYESVLRLPFIHAGGEHLLGFLSQIEKESFYYNGTHLICLWLDAETKAAMKDGLPCIDPRPFLSYMLFIQPADIRTEAGYALRMTLFPVSRFVKAASGDSYLFPDFIACNYYSLLLEDSLSSACEEYFLPQTVRAGMSSPLSACHALTGGYGTHGKKVSG